jgi:hypothetical protein
MKGENDMNRKIISTFLVFIMILSLGTITFAKTGNEKIDWLVEKKFVEGDGSGDLNLNGNLTREEAATIIVKALGKETLVASYQNVENIFKDMNSKVWSNGMVNVAVQEKIVSGFPDKTFGPKKNITYQEIITMLVQVKGGLTAEEQKAGVWPTPYILKANELGILDSSMKSLDYKKDATRLVAFEMLYNTVKPNEDKDLNAYKAIVREVERVYSIDKDELGLTIFKDSNNASKYKSNEYTRIKHTNKDSLEDLLGKVVKVKLDDNNNLKSYEIDNSYDYLMGKAEFRRDEVTLNGKTYDILFKDSSDNVNNKLQFVYHNDEEIDYNDFYNKVESDFARITVDGNKVLAIESFSFSKAEPILKVDGNKVTFTDERSMVIDRAILIKDNVLKTVDLADIQDFSIGHVYGDRQILVTEEVELDGILDNVLYKDREGVVVRVDNKDYKVSDKFHMVYSTDGDKFIVLDSDKAYDDLYLIRGQEVKFGVDAAGNIKYVVSSKTSDEDFYIVSRVSSNHIRLIDKSGKKVEFEISLKTLIKDVNKRDIKLNSLKEGDLVYIIKDGKDINNLYLVKDFEGMKIASISINKNSDGKFALDKKYIVDKDTNSFLFHEDSKGITDIESMEVNKVLENTKSDAKLKAYIISDYDFDRLKVGDKVITSGDKDQVNTILFTGFKQSLKNSKEEIVRLRYKFRVGYDDEIEGFVGDKSVVYKVEKNAKLIDINPDEYVKLFINENNEVIGVELIFNNSDKYLEVTKLESSSGKVVEITVKENSKEKSYWVTSDYIEIGFVKEGSLVKLHFNQDGEVDIILVK